jgi:DNA replication protein DnaC
VGSLAVDAFSAISSREILEITPNRQRRRFVSLPCGMAEHHWTRFSRVGFPVLGHVKLRMTMTTDCKLDAASYHKTWQWDREDYLHEVLTAEQASRHESVIRQRLREARFPEVKTLDTFDFTAAEGIFAGPIGTGKTHLAIALGVEATKQKRRVFFTRAADCWLSR